MPQSNPLKQPFAASAKWNREPTDDLCDGADLRVVPAEAEAHFCMSV